MIFKRQTFVHLVGISFFFIFDFIFYYVRVVRDLQIPLAVYCFICLVFALHIWFFNYLTVWIVDRVYPGLEKNIQKRVVAFVLIIPFIVFLTSAFQSLFFNLLNRSSEVSLFYFHYEDAGMNLLYSLIIILFLELLYYFRHWAKALTETAALKQKNAETLLASLKDQVNPHFLFNSLNSLSSLIQSSPNQAVSFVHELSGVYRFLLQSNKRPLIEIRDEFAFLNSYMHLLQTRFGEALKYTIEIPPLFDAYLIPPLTMQLLVENAVKHNIVSTNQPLLIDLNISDDRLVIKNNLQKKKTPVTSNRMGLMNIISKYGLLTDEDVEITETEKEFIVTLPLLKKDVYDGISHRG